MPTYLLHGFRWPRPLIRIHIILQNLDDAAAEWLVAPGSSETLTENLKQLYPDSMAHLPRLRFVEQYDPHDESPGSGSQPFAYVADMCEEVKLGIAVDDVISRGIRNEQWAAMMELRDKLAPEEKVSWYVVVCGDEERWAPSVLTPPPETGGVLQGAHRGSESDGYSNSASDVVSLPPVSKATLVC